MAQTKVQLIEGLNIDSSGAFYVDGSAGTAGQVLTSGGVGSSATWQDAAGGGSLDFVASGTIANGDTVVINSDGTVSTVAKSGTTTPSSGTPTVFETGSNAITTSTFDSSANKVIIAYRDSDNSSYGTVVVGTVSGTSISFGTPVVFNSASSSDIALTFDPSTNKVVLAYTDNPTANGYAKVGTVSGTSISFGSGTVFNSNAKYNALVFDSFSNKVVVACRDSTASNGKARVATISGTSITFGSETVFETGLPQYLSATFDSYNNKVVLAYNDYGNSSYGTAVVGTVSGTTISFGSPVVFETSTTAYISATFDSLNNKAVIAYSDAANSYSGAVVVGTVSGTTIGFGVSTTFGIGGCYYVSAVFDTSTNKVAIVYRDNGNSSYGVMTEGVVAGTNFTTGSSLTFESDVTTFPFATFDSSNSKVVVAYRDDNNSFYGTAVVVSTSSYSTNLRDGNFIGLAAQAISNGATGTINIIGGVNEAQTGLTTAKKYYVDPNGGLTLNAPTDGSAVVVAGTSISSTKLLIKG